MYFSIYVNNLLPAELTAQNFIPNNHGFLMKYLSNEPETPTIKFGSRVSVLGLGADHQILKL
jgi:hypothetical protein